MNTQACVESHTSLVLFLHKINSFLQCEIMLKMSVSSPPLISLYFLAPFFTSVPTLWKTATRAAVVVQRIFNCTDMQSMRLIVDKILKLLTYYTLFYHLSLRN